MNTYAPVVTTEIPPKAKKLFFKNCGVSCFVYEYNNHIFVPSNVSVGKLSNAIDYPWLNSARDNYTNNLVTTKILKFDSRNRAATFLYGNLVQATKAYSECNENNEEVTTKVDNGLIKNMEKDFETKSKSFDYNDADFDVLRSIVQAKENEKKQKEELERIKNTTEPVVNELKTLESEVQSLKSIGSDIAEAIQNISAKSGVSIYEPYDKGLDIVKEEDFQTYLDNLDMILNQDNITEIMDTLETSGVSLAGKAGIGKGVIINNIGAKLAKKHGYHSFAKLIVNCGGTFNPIKATWGTGMNNVEYRGALYTACRYAMDKKDCAVVLAFDEIGQTDCVKVLGSANELLSSKIDHSNCTLEHSEPDETKPYDTGYLEYVSNLYIILTGNIGNSYKSGELTDDEQFNQRFVPVHISGLFESKAYINKYAEYLTNNVNSKFSAKEYSEALYEIYDSLEDESRSLKVVSLRRINTFARKAVKMDNFIADIKSLIPSVFEDKK
jgi:hypothetical protein